MFENVFLEIIPQKEITYAQIWWSCWSFHITSRRDHTAAGEQWYQHILRTVSCVRWSSILLEPQLALSYRDETVNLTRRILLTLQSDIPNTSVFMLLSRTSWWSLNCYSHQLHIWRCSYLYLCHQWFPVTYIFVIHVFLFEKCYQFLTTAQPTFE